MALIGFQIQKMTLLPSEIKLHLTKVCQNWWEIQLQPVILHKNLMQAHQLRQASGR
jgi:hypothetical protein